MQCHMNTGTMSCMHIRYAHMYYVCISNLYIILWHVRWESKERLSLVAC